MRGSGLSPVGGGGHMKECKGGVNKAHILLSPINVFLVKAQD